jgi:hypothetical protein
MKHKKNWYSSMARREEEEKKTQQKKTNETKRDKMQVWKTREKSEKRQEVPAVVHGVVKFRRPSAVLHS